MNPLDELYGASPEQFMALRETLAARAKQQGDKALAQELKKQRKPTQAAHALNRVSRDARPELDALFEAGKALASGKDFKTSLERQRSALEKLKQKLSGPDAQAVLAVVQGALVDEPLAHAVRLGRFDKLPAAVPVGFFGAAPEGAPPVPAPKRSAPLSPPPRHSAPPPAPVRRTPPRALELSAPKSTPPPALPVSSVKVPVPRTTPPHGGRPAALGSQPRQSPPSPPQLQASVAAELVEAEKEAATLDAELLELERELIETRRRAHQARERVARLKKRLEP